MPVTDTSRSAYRQERVKLSGQELELFKLYRKNHSVLLSDRQVAELMGWEPAHASARRNGLISILRRMRSEYRLVSAKLKCATTGKVVKHWRLIQEADEQGMLF